MNFDHIMNLWCRQHRQAHIKTLDVNFFPNYDGANILFNCSLILYHPSFFARQLHQRPVIIVVRHKR